MTITLVTTGPRDPSAVELVERFLARARVDCAACGGDAARCTAGAGAPDFARLQGCAAYDDDGALRPLQAVQAPRQPWEPRAA